MNNNGLCVEAERLTIAFYSKFSSEYDFLEARLRYYKSVPPEADLHVRHILYIEETYWSGAINSIDYKRLDKLTSEYDLIYYVNEASNNQTVYERSARRDREDLANCKLAHITCAHKRSHCSLHILCDIDELLSIEEMKELDVYAEGCGDCPIFIEQDTSWFTTSYRYDEKWRGPVAFKILPEESLVALIQLSRHLPEPRSRIFKGGVHLSYLKSSIQSKINNSHGLTYKNIRLMLALCGIHPFRRKTKRLKADNKFYNMNYYFRQLSYSRYDLCSYLTSFRWRT
jgi:hypothetical protein